MGCHEGAPHSPHATTDGGIELTAISSNLPPEIDSEIWLQLLQELGAIWAELRQLGLASHGAPVRRPGAYGDGYVPYASPDDSRGAATGAEAGPP